MDAIVAPAADLGEQLRLVHVAYISGRLRPVCSPDAFDWWLVDEWDLHERPVLIDEVEPRASWTLLQHPLHSRPISDHPIKPVPSVQVPLATDAEHSQPGLSKPLALARPGPDVFVSPDHRQVPSSHPGDPIGIQRSSRAIRDQLVTDVNGVFPGSLERLAKAKGTFINKETQLVSVGRHV